MAFVDDHSESIAATTGTTGSFQNQTDVVIDQPTCSIVCRRKRDMMAVIAEAGANQTFPSNDNAKRTCKVNSLAAITGCFTSQKKRISDSACSESTINVIFKKHEEVFKKGLDYLLSFIEQNASFELQKALGIVLMGTAMKDWGEGICDAAIKASQVSGYSDRTIRSWMQSYMQSIFNVLSHGNEDITSKEVEYILSSERGEFPKYETLVHDEEFKMHACSYIRSNACKKGEPNLTTGMFSEWVNKEYNQSISTETARRWLHSFGFSQVHHQKGVYFDGHERQDVIQHRREFVSTLFELDKITITADNLHPVCPANVRPLIRVVHDESTFYANCDQSYYWGDSQTSVLKQKSLGNSIMVSDFIDECDGYLEFNGNKARVMIEVHKDGYFNNNSLMIQVENAVKIFEAKYPHARGLFLFDNAPSHKKVADDQLDAEKMNVGVGGKQPILRDTVWNGEIQHLVLEDGRPKGMKMVLQERGIDTRGMNADKMRSTLKTFDDFRVQKSILEEYIEQRGHLCLFFPKYHCELSPIERVWCHAKKHTRAYANGKINTLRKIVPEGLESCSKELIYKFFRKCRDYEQAYRNGSDGSEVDKVVKVYKSHRRVSTTSS